MQLLRTRRFLGGRGALLLGTALLLSMGGCPIDNNAVLTASLQAALTSSTQTVIAVLQAAMDAAGKSLVDSLSQYLAGH